MLTNTNVIPGLHANLFSMTRLLQKGFKVTPLGKTLILRKHFTDIRFDKKMASKAGEGFLLTTNFYNSANYASLLDPKKRNLEGKAYIQPKGAAIKKQENTTTKQIAMRKIHAKELHMKLGHPG